MADSATNPLPPALLAAASRLLARRGPEGFTMDELARAAKLSRATLYRHVRSRSAVLDALGGAGARAHTRQRILAAARTVFCRAGFEGATIEEVATEAGVGLATVYRHFKDRDGLVAAFLDSAGPRRATREAARRPSGDLARDLQRLAEKVLRSFRENQSLMRLVLLETLRGGPMLKRVRALAPTRRSLTHIAALLKPHVLAGRLRGEDPVALAQAFTGMLLSFGLVGPVLHDTAQADPEATARLVTGLFLHGALAPTPTPTQVKA